MIENPRLYKCLILIVKISNNDFQGKEFKTTQVIITHLHSTQQQCTAVRACVAIVVINPQNVNSNKNPVTQIKL